MHIAFFSHYFAPEIGALARVYDLAQAWMKLGASVEVATCFPNHPVGQIYPGYQSGIYQREAIDGITVHRHWTYMTPNKGFLKKTMGHASYLPSAALVSNRRIGRTDVAIGTSPTFFAAMAAAHLARRRKVPFIMEVRDLWPAIFVELGVLKNRTAIKLLERWELSLYRQAARVVTVTEEFRRNLIERGVPERKVLTIPNGADVDYWKPGVANPEPLRRELGLEGKFTVLYLGTHGISQALSAIVKAAALLRGEPEIQFLFVGEGAEKARLMEEARSSGLTNIRFLDPVDKPKVREFYALSDVCLVPLRNIPLFSTFIPSKMFEMLAMQKPVLGSVAGEAAGILHRSGGAEVVPPEDSQAIAQAVRRLAHERHRLPGMGQAGREFVIRHYSRQALAATYLEFLNEAVHEHKATRR